MKYKSLIITLLLSSIFLSIITCVWKIMATLQGLSFKNLNFNLNLMLVLGLTLTSIFIGNKFNHFLKILILSLLFTIIYNFIFYFTYCLWVKFLIGANCRQIYIGWTWIKY